MINIILGMLFGFAAVCIYLFVLVVKYINAADEEYMQEMAFEASHNPDRTCKQETKL